MQDDDSESKPQFNLSISIDRDKFFRRTCPACGRDFKTEIDKADIAWAVAPHFQRMGLEIGVKRDQNGKETTQTHLFCPYCHHNAEASEMLTGEVMAYIRRYMMREVVLPLTKGLFSGLEDIGRGSGGFISLRIEHSRSIYPPRPMHGPEPPDMKIIEFLCCGKKAKIANSCHQVCECVFCGSLVTLI